MNRIRAAFGIVLTTIALVHASAAGQAPFTPTFRDAPPAQPFPEIYGEIDGELARETPHFRIYVEKGFSPADLDWLQAEVETIHAYLSQRIGPTDERFSLTLRPPDKRTCPVRGFARWGGTSSPHAIVFADEKTSREQVLGVLAHEVAHLFHRYVLKAMSDDQNLNEGLATWGAGKYWEAWQKASLAEGARAFKRDGRYLPLSEYLRPEVAERSSTGENCLKDRDLRYGSWAAFIDFLIGQYGLEKFRKLLGPVEEPVQNADRQYVLVFPEFQKVYGLPLEALEKAWWEELSKAR